MRACTSSGTIRRRSERVAALAKSWEQDFALSDSSREETKRIRSNFAQCRQKSTQGLHTTPHREANAVLKKKKRSIENVEEETFTQEKSIVKKKRGIKQESVQKKLNSPSLPLLKVPKSEELKRLDGSFYDCDALDLAPRLLGKLIRRENVILQITEVEAYRQNDTACHARAGKTARTAPLFGPGGHAYVYLCYGLHVMLNVVADKDGVGAAVLIRSCAPVSGLETIQERRKQQTIKPVLLTGPGKVGQALGLTTAWTSHPLYTPGGVEILDGPDPGEILVGPRVGIDYAAPDDVAALWRFAIAGTPWVSAPRNTLLARGKLQRAEINNLNSQLTLARSIEDVRSIHNRISANGKQQSVCLVNTLIHMYGVYGSVKDARLAFDRVQNKDVYTYNAMIDVYIGNGRPRRVYIHQSARSV